jgi:hypothetical protein
VKVSALCSADLFPFEDIIPDPHPSLRILPEFFPVPLRSNPESFEINFQTEHLKTLSTPDKTRLDRNIDIRYISTYGEMT